MDPRGPKGDRLLPTRRCLWDCAQKRPLWRFRPSRLDAWDGRGADLNATMFDTSSSRVAAAADDYTPEGHLSRILWHGALKDSDLMAGVGEISIKEYRSGRQIRFNAECSERLGQLVDRHTHIVY